MRLLGTTQLCIADLQAIVDGRVVLGTMPPLAGLSETIGRVVLDPSAVRPRDVLWLLAKTSSEVIGCVNGAFSRQALGVVVAGMNVEPWAGKFCLTVPDTMAALRRLVRCCGAQPGARQPVVFSCDPLTNRVLGALRRNDDYALHECMEDLTRSRALAA